MRRAALVLLALGALVPLRAGASGATFVAATANPGATFATAADFNTVAVAPADPGANLRGTVTLSATAASDRGVASVRFQSAPAGTSTWTDVCTDTTAPYGCAFDTAAVADGPRDVRAVATDTAGYSRIATVASRRVDNTAPATALSDPGSPLTGTKALSATASDSGSGLASTVLQHRASGGSWTDICAQASCSLNTATLPDGLYDVRSLATDLAGNTSTSVVSSRRVDNTAPSVTLPALGAVRGTITVAATSDDGNGAGVSSVRYQMRPSGASAWTDVCTSVAAPFSCATTTTTVADGLYEAHAIATDVAGFTTTSATVTLRVDNAAPTTATLADPGTPLAGTVTLTGTATDGGSGIASVRFQRSPAGAGTWTDVCADATSPYTCAWDTTGVADAVYDLRTLVTDNAGNTLASTMVANRRVDNNGPTVTLTDPGSPLRGSVTVGATASDPAGVASVVIQRRTTTTWTTICTDNSAPYSCAWATTGVADGLYDLRATATDTLGRGSTSAIVSARRVDNTAPTATGIQAVNGTGAPGQIDTGDILTFTYSEAMSPASILSGWDGTDRAVTVRITNSTTVDKLSVWDQSNSVRLNLTSATADLQLRANRTPLGARFAATARVTGAQVTITLGALASGSTSASTSTTPMVWTPSTAATDLAGNAASGTAFTETGTADVDF